VPYFHVVFTVPAAVAEIAFHNKATVCPGSAPVSQI